MSANGNSSSAAAAASSSKRKRAVNDDDVDVDDDDDSENGVLGGNANVDDNEFRYKHPKHKSNGAMKTKTTTTTTAAAKKKKKALANGYAATATSSAATATSSPVGGGGGGGGAQRAQVSSVGGNKSSAPEAAAAGSVAAQEREDAFVAPSAQTVIECANELPGDDYARKCLVTNGWLKHRALPGTFAHAQAEDVSQVSAWFGGHLPPRTVKFNAKKGAYSVKNVGGRVVAYYENAAQAKEEALKLYGQGAKKLLNRRRTFVKGSQRLVEVEVQVLPTGLVNLLKGIKKSDGGEGGGGDEETASAAAAAVINDNMTTILFNESAIGVLDKYIIRLSVRAGDEYPIVTTQYEVDEAGECTTCLKRLPKLVNSLNMRCLGGLSCGDYRDLRSSLDGSTQVAHLKKNEDGDGNDGGDDDYEDAAAAAAAGNGKGAPAVPLVSLASLVESTGVASPSSALKNFRHRGNFSAASSPPSSSQAAATRKASSASIVHSGVSAKTIQKMLDAHFERIKELIEKK